MPRNRSPQPRDDRSDETTFKPGDNEVARLERLAWLPHVEEKTVEDLVARTGDLRTILESFLHPESDDLGRHRLAFAVRILEKLEPGTRNAPPLRQLRDEIVDEAYRTWKQHWLNGAALVVLPVTKVLPLVGRVLERDGELTQFWNRHGLERDLKELSTRDLDAVDLGERNDWHSSVVGLAALNTTAQPPGFLKFLLNKVRGNDHHWTEFTAQVMRDSTSLPVREEALNAVAQLFEGPGSDACTQYGAAHVVSRLAGVAARDDILAGVCGLFQGRQEEAVRFMAATALLALGSFAANQDVLDLLGGKIAERHRWHIEAEAEEEAYAGLSAHLPTHAGRDRFEESLHDRWKKLARKIDEKPLCEINSGGIQHQTNVLVELYRVGSFAVHPDLLNELERLLGHADARARRWAAGVVDRLGEEASTPRVLGRLERLLGDEDPYLRIRASEILARADLDTNSEAIVESLVGVLQGKDPNERIAAAQAIASLQPPRAPDTSLDALARLFEHEDADVRRVALTALGGLGVGILARADERPGPRFQAICARLESGLKDREASVRMTAAEAIAGLLKRPAGRHEVPEQTATELQLCLKRCGRSKTMAPRACEVIAAIGPSLTDHELLTDLVRRYETKRDEHDRNLGLVFGSSLPEITPMAMTLDQLMLEGFRFVPKPGGWEVDYVSRDQSKPN